MNLRLKLAFTNLILVAGCALVLAGGGLWLVHQERAAALRARLADAALLTADRAADPSVGTTRLGEIAAVTARRLGARVAIVDAGGRVLADTRPGTASVENLADRPEVLDALAGRRGEARGQDTLGAVSLAVAVPIVTGGQPAGAVRVAVSEGDLEGVSGQLLSLLIVAAAVVATLAAGVTWFTTGALTRPLHDLTTLVDRAARGDLRSRLHVGSSDELGRLTASFNRMASELDQTVALLAAERNEMSALLETSSDGLLIVDASQRIQRINPAALRLLDCQHRPVLGHALHAVTRDYALAALVADSLRTGEVARQILEQGGSRSRAYSAVVVPMGQGRVTELLLTLHDITEVRRLELLRRQFVANISHEIRTPLATAKLIVETLVEVGDDAAIRGKLLQRVNGEIDALTSLVQELMELSKLESGEVSLNYGQTDLRHLVESVQERMRPLAERGAIALIVEADTAPLPAIVLDAERIQRVLLNLVYNALKFTHEGGSVTIGGQADANSVTLWVRDTGAGIAPEDLPRVFERFFKADPARSSEGSGLGLAIVKHTVQAHGGAVWVESALGRGSTFYLSLPLQPPQAPPVHEVDDVGVTSHHARSSHVGLPVGGA